MRYYSCERVERWDMLKQNKISATVSRTIETVQQEAQYDACVKRLLSEKIILAWILKECVSEFRRFSIAQIMKDCIEGEPTVSMIAVDQDELDYMEETVAQQIEGMNTEDSSIREGKIYYDIRFSAVVPDTKEPIQLIINIEAQKSDKTPYPLIKRAIYYGSRMISAQKNKIFTKSHYEKIRKVYSVWIQMNVDEEKANTITRYRITEENVAGAVTEKESDYDLLTVIMLGLGSADEAENEPILRLLDVLLSSKKKPEEKKEILEKDFNIPMSEAMSEEANVMCNLGEGLYETAYETAYAEASETTALKTQANIVLHMMQTKNYSMEDAFEAIGASETDQEKIRELVDAQLAVK